MGYSIAGNIQKTIGYPGDYDAPAGYGLTLERISEGDISEGFGTADTPDVVTEEVFHYTITDVLGTVRTFNRFGLGAKIGEILRA